MRKDKNFQLSSFVPSDINQSKCYSPHGVVHIGMDYPILEFVVFYIASCRILERRLRSRVSTWEVYPTWSLTNSSVAQLRVIMQHVTHPAFGVAMAESGKIVEVRSKALYYGNFLMMHIFTGF